jgi:hypothetical protein
MTPSISAMTLIVCAALALPVTSAHASPCGDEIARLEQGSPALGPSGQQSIGAQLGHQPTPQSVQQAEAASQARFASLLERAKGFEAQGKTAECMQAVAAAKHELE